MAGADGPAGPQGPEGPAGPKGDPGDPNTLLPITADKIHSGAASNGQVLAVVDAVEGKADWVRPEDLGLAGWSMQGNAGTVSGTHFLGTTDARPLEIRVSNARVLLLEPETAATGPNLIAGYSANQAVAGVVGATVAGGGNPVGIVAGSSLVPAPNRVTDHYGAIGGGWGNQAGHDDGLVDLQVCATVAGGSQNAARGVCSTVPGGYGNTAQGDFSLAAGRRAKANFRGSFVWADFSADADCVARAENMFVVRAAGGIWLGTSGPATPLAPGRFLQTSSGAYLSSGGVWTNTSDRNLKEHFRAVDRESILEKVARLPLQEWNYKSEDDEVRHIGPTAQDFHAAFKLGRSDTSISTIDPAGVALVAIQALEARGKRLRRDQETLVEENRALRARLERLETRLARLLERLGEGEME